MLNFIRGSAQALRWTCIVVSLGAIGLALVALFNRSPDRGVALLTLLAGGLNAGTLLLLGSDDVEDRRLRSQTRKLLLKLRIQEVQYHLDPRPGVAPLADAERRRYLLNARW